MSTTTRLVLTRRIGETIIVEHAGEVLEVSLHDIATKGQAKIAFVAPKSFNIQRAERIERFKERDGNTN